MNPLRVLIVEDSDDDAQRVALELRRGGYRAEVRRVGFAGLGAALDEGACDVVVAAHAPPRQDGLAALRLVRERLPEMPFVLLAEAADGEGAAGALHAGDGELVTRGDLASLAPAVRRAIADARARRERREVGDQLREAVAARDAFLSVVSHELKTPLTSLHLQLESLYRAVQQGGAGSERVSERIRTVARSTERLGELVNRLLDVSRITGGGGIELTREALDLADLAREVAARFRESAAEAGSRLALDLPPGATGAWDRERLDAVLTNLLSNAVKYGEGGPIELTLRAEEERVRLTVRDHGIGIEPADQERIFERFERAVPEHHYGGFGIGLWLARSIAEAHGGTIRVESRPGDGSSFTLELPRGKAGSTG